MQLAPHKRTLPGYHYDVTYRWRTSGGVFIAPKNMETRHLFHTLRMIWNNSMPKHMHVGRNIKYYSFGGFYTEEYMMRSVYHIFHELTKRNDLTEEQIRELELMYSFLYSRLEHKPANLKVAHNNSP